jgi:hypothetical protein
MMTQKNPKITSEILNVDRIFTIINFPEIKNKFNNCDEPIGPYCDGPLLHNERLLTDVISTETNTENYPITRNS